MMPSRPFCVLLSAKSTIMLYKTLLLLIVTLLPIVSEAANNNAKYLSAKEAAKLRTQIIDQWKSDTRQRLRSVYQQKKAYTDTLSMPLWWAVYGTKPDDGYSLYISLHGGGGTTPEANDQQWRNQMRLYRPDHAVYVAPRSPWNIWDMWCHEGIDPMYEQIIQMAIVYLDVNPDKVYIMGYSAGGDGVWRMAPRMADRWAAASMMAGHPGDVSMLNLRNTPYMIWCGELDAAYNRNILDAERGLEIDSLQRDDPEGYVHKTTIARGMGHWMNRIDTTAVTWMAQYKRNPYPKKIVWQQEEVLKPCFYWIEVPEQEMKRYKQVRLQVEGNTIDLTRCDYSQITLWLNDDIVNLNKKVKVTRNGKTLFYGKVFRTEANLRESLKVRNDPSYCFPAKLTVTVN